MCGPSCEGCQYVVFPKSNNEKPVFPQCCTKYLEIPEAVSDLLSRFADADPFAKETAVSAWLTTLFLDLNKVDCHNLRTIISNAGILSHPGKIPCHYCKLNGNAMIEDPATEDDRVNIPDFLRSCSPVAYFLCQLDEISLKSKKTYIANTEQLAQNYGCPEEYLKKLLAQLNGLLENTEATLNLEGM